MQASDSYIKEICVLGSEGYLGSRITSHLRSAGHMVHGYDLNCGFDFTNPHIVSQIFAERSYDVLINAFALDQKGWQQSRSFLDQDIEESARYFDVNVVATYKACVEFIRVNKTGCIINISSIYATEVPVPGAYGGGDKTFAYGSSKAALEYLTKYLAKHAGPNYQVSCLRLGGVEDVHLSEDFREGYLSRSLSNSMVQFDEILRSIDFLMDDKSPNVTGEILSITGGYGI